LQIFQVRVPDPVHAGAEIDKPAGRLDQGGEQVRAEDVHGEDVGEAVDCLHASRAAVADPGVVHDGVIGSCRVRLPGQLADGCDAGQIPDHHALGSGSRSKRVAAAGLIAGVEDHLLAARDQFLGCPQPQSVRRSGDDDAGH
jgi:hypothetical protein